MSIRSTVLIVFLLVCFSVKGQLPVKNLGENNQLTVDLIPFTGYYFDSTGKVPINQMLADDISFDTLFKKYQFFKYPSAIWLKARFYSRNGIHNKYLLFKGTEQPNEFLSEIDYIDVYYVQNDKVISHYKSGILVPKSEKFYQERASVAIIPFKIAAGDSTSIYIRLSGAYQQNHINLNLAVTNPITNISYTKDGVKRLFYSVQAMFLIIGLFVLIFWFFVGHNSYIYFAGFCFLYTIHHLHITPYSSMIDLFFPENPYLAEPLHAIATWGSMFFLLLFGYSFSDIKQIYPRWAIYYQLILIIYGILGLWGTANFLYEPYPSYKGNFTIALLIVFPIAVRFLFSKHQLAKIVGFGIIWFISWRIVGVVTLIRPFFGVGQLGLLLLYALGLGYKLMDNERQKAKADHLRKLDEIKTKFFANISHEFRTPLSLILGPLHTAMNKRNPGKEIEGEDNELIKYKHVKMMHQNAVRLHNLVDQILDLSKLDQDKMELNLQKSSVSNLLVPIFASFESLAEQKHITFTSSLPDKMPTMYIDRQKLETIVVNLLSNALKYTPPEGEVKIDINYQNTTLKITVSDTGKGITPEEIDKIFERYYRVEVSDDLGTGIGLALVKELVKLHGGAITVTSKINQGTQFEVNIPIMSDLMPTDNKLIEEKHQYMMTTDIKEMKGISNIGEKPHVDLPMLLIIEDNDDLREYIADEMSDQFEIITAKDGQGGLDVAMAMIPELIISDIMMPGIDGITLCKLLKNNIQTCHIPIILLTAKIAKDAKIKGLETGADDYMTKPFDGRELKLKAGNMIDQSRRIRQKFTSELSIRPSKLSVHSMDEKFMLDVTTTIENHIGDETFSVEVLAKAVGFSTSQLNRKLKALINKSSIQLIRYFRLMRAKELLEQKSATVSEIAFAVGFNNLSHFSKSYKDVFGVLPSNTKSIE